MTVTLQLEVIHQYIYCSSKYEKRKEHKQTTNKNSNGKKSKKINNNKINTLLTMKPTEGEQFTQTFYYSGNQ